MPLLLCTAHTAAPKPPLHKPSDGVTPDSCPFAHSPPWSPPQARSPKPKLLHPAPVHTGGHVSQAGDCRVMVLTVCTGFFPFWLLQTSCCILLRGSKASALSQLTSLLVRGLPRFRNLPSLIASSKGHRSSSTSFLSFIFFFSFLSCPVA